ncbi:DUF6303 family protein [Streptomyces sp. NPDC057543]|uniref:DUF6303 family protein n=1 Tax=Streptomyces sp. NPDC057543 TaxID=3346163 RepID=UPI0036C86B36
MSALPVASARLGNTFDGTWELYVVTDGPSTDWPEYFFDRVVPVPTLDERVRALAALGFKLATDAEWEWQELRSGPMDRVELLAAADVLPTGGTA